MSEDFKFGSCELLEIEILAGVCGDRFGCVAGGSVVRLLVDDLYESDPLGVQALLQRPINNR